MAPANFSRPFFPSAPYPGNNTLNATIVMALPHAPDTKRESESLAKQPGTWIAVVVAALMLAFLAAIIFSAYRKKLQKRRKRSRKGRDADELSTELGAVDAAADRRAVRAARLAQGIDREISQSRRDFFASPPEDRRPASVPAFIPASVPGSARPKPVSRSPLREHQERKARRLVADRDEANRVAPRSGLERHKSAPPPPLLSRIDEIRSSTNNSREQPPAARPSFDRCAESAHTIALRRKDRNARMRDLWSLHETNLTPAGPMMDVPLQVESQR